MHANGVMHRPGQILNCDESGMPFTQKLPEVIVHVGHPYSISAWDKSQIIILACGSAAGYTIPPMVVFDRKSLTPDMTLGKCLECFMAYLSYIAHSTSPAHSPPARWAIFSLPARAATPSSW